MLDEDLRPQPPVNDASTAGRGTGGALNAGGRPNQGGRGNGGRPVGRAGSGGFPSGGSPQRAGSPSFGGNPGGMTGFGGYAAGFNCGMRPPDCYVNCVCDTGGDLPLCEEECFGQPCSQPNCVGCGDCYSDCMCNNQDPFYCDGLCFGWDAGMPSEVCMGSSGESFTCPAFASGGPQFAGCCLSPTECGVRSDSAQLFGLPNGCIAVDRLYEKGVPDTSCDVGAPFPGCCRPDGTCGVAFDIFGLGCLPGPFAGGARRCGVQNPGPCCEPSGTPACEDPAIADCVCAADPFCCEQFWDESCVAQVDTEGCGTCQDPTQDAGVGCPDGMKRCGGLCVAPQPEIGCGTDSCAACPAPPANAAAVCQAGACEFECDAGFTRVGDLCEAQVQP